MSILKRTSFIFLILAFVLTQVLVVAADPVGPQVSVNYADVSGNPITGDAINYRQIDPDRDLVCSINYVINRQTGDWDYVNDPAEDVFVYYWKRLGHSPIQGRVLPAAVSEEGQVWSCDVYGVVGDQNNILLLGRELKH